MFSYSISVRPLNNQNSKLKAFVTVTIDDIMDIEGFKIIDGSNGLFVSVPSHKGTVTEDGVSVEKYFDDVRFKGEDGTSFAEELKSSIINQYNNRSQSSSNHSNSSRAATAAVNAKAAPAASANSKPPRDRKPLWGY
jgi:DNA-binding cell septation regulator SpoVG